MEESQPSDNDALLDTLNKINGILALVILVIGMTGNILSGLICLRPKLRKVPTFIFYAMLLFSDAFTLTIWNVDQFLVAFFDTHIERHGLYSCKVATFIQTFSLQFSSWLLVLMTAERYMSVRFVKWRMNYFKAKTAFLISIITGSILFIINTSFAINMNYADDSITNSSLVCFETYGFYIWMQVINI